MRAKRLTKRGPVAAPRSGEAAPRRTKPHAQCIVGIGASAGGFDAIVKLLDALPPATGLAFVVIQHLPATHQSRAAELFARRTAMPVVEARDGMRVEANHVYTNPPGHRLSIKGRVLRAEPLTAAGATRLTVDHFFASLAADQAERSVGIVLSGTGSDGAIGARAIVAAGGIVLAQDPASAPYGDMPRSVIEAKMASFVLPPEDMPAVLVRYVQHPYVARPAPRSGQDESVQAEVDLILEQVHARRGASFAGYKRPMLLRRIHRRMGLCHVERMEEYRALLERNTGEVDALIRDMLIGVTQFFRDPDAWKALARTVVEPIVQGKARDDPIRAWVAACATGEEAYSLAMLLLEGVAHARKACLVRVFATDANEDALEVGRSGRYPAGIAAHVGPDRLRRFFTKSEDGKHYQVKEALRKAVVFGTQNLCTDPPFSRLDLVTCRNVLIYFQPEVQQKLIGIFHFALQPGGWLFLGGAETAEGRHARFDEVSRKWRIYRRAEGNAVGRPELVVAGSERSAAPGRAGPVQPAFPRSAVKDIARGLLVDHFGPPAVLVGNRYEVLYFFGPIERYLAPPRGAPSTEILSLAREGLRSRLRSALREADATRTAVTVDDARIKVDGGFEQVRITVTPVGDSSGTGRALLVVFQTPPKPPARVGARGAHGAALRQLEAELRASEEDLRSTVESLQAANEELKASNEEVNSANEELKSINEEVESSREELQSVNEEMSTVNQQLEGKVHELEAANSDLRNLISSTEIATLCLDNALAIKWFTPAVQQIFNLLPGDIGRNINDFATGPVGATMIDDARAVMASLVPKQCELAAADGRIFLRRTLPYRAEADRVAGVIVTFVDVTESRLATRKTLEAKQSFADELEVQVKRRTASLQAMAVALSRTEERERRALAQDLHDDLGQMLALANIRLASIREGAPPALKPEIEALAGTLEEANRGVRAIATELSPAVLHELGLQAGLAWLSDDMRRRFGLHVDLQDDGAPKPLESSTAVAVFRMVRELLINVAKHAGVGASHVFASREDDRVVIVVEDGGHGFDPFTPATPDGETGFGLLSVRERIELLGGTLNIESRPGDGTVATLSVPLPATPPDSAAGR